MTGGDRVTERGGTRCVSRASAWAWRGAGELEGRWSRMTHPVHGTGQRMDITSRDWPLQSGLPLGPIPTAVPCARAHTTQVLWEWGMSEMSDSAELIVSELITNAVTASRILDDEPFPVRFWILSGRKQVLILVWY